ncbi:HAD family hydrolase [Mucilaginibacter phyllosphaerae]|uniref:Beta-phosphoglucomutase family hydrolase n=1 Tax=Mucilaginibacter phyllosphaerae TaxID=1812349 RepID=A0A4Y8AK71_9SPHI|nr:HAD family phosphatase [Mucilaginibacter phyllosphaerae]MBB3967535.1 beta-phosphoglucomutase family hydrolase [Mucilaginibacter phyllosphaerae]TEW69404.1 HAD family phosphatase [Mucilaginibacter phyllosphaerae]GGH21274.1 beta-phosphoglucomutase [Mucilaginibacter phyllosphaerae]
MSDKHIGLQGTAAIFDMDGTLIDNTPYHYQAWQQLFKKRGMPGLSKETYLTGISGVPILNTLKTYFGEDTGEAELQALINEKKQLYEAAFTPFLRPVNGLETYLKDLKNAGVKIALATSSNMDDVDFIFNTIPIRRYFDAIITGGMVSEPKPSPQIFLKAAQTLNTRPQQCVVFEDSLSGLKAGNNAGMKVVGITTAHPAQTVRKLADLAIKDYTGISLHTMAQLFEQHER